MKWIKNYGNTDAGPYILNLPVFNGGTASLAGALLTRGASADTNDGFLIIPSSVTGNLTGVVGVQDAPNTNAVSGSDSNTTGTNYTTNRIIVNTDAVFGAEYSQGTSDILAVGSTSGATVTIGSLEAGIGRGWLYAVSGTGAGRLAFIITSASGSCVTKETTGWDATTKVVKILPQLYKKAILNSTADKLSTQAATGGTGYFIWTTTIEADSIPSAELNPTKHSGLTGLNLVNTKFTAQVSFTIYAQAVN